MRYPSVAGTFYNSDKNELKKEIEGYIEKANKELTEKGIAFKRVFGAVCPHAGYTYSGWVAAYSYSFLKALPKWTTFVILSPNHTGRGKSVAISRDDWMTPLGIVKNDREFGDAIKRNSGIADFDEEAHLFEHSAEVQLPFLQTTIENPKVVEISMAVQGYEIVKDLGNAIHKATKDTRREIAIIASSDFTHFETAESAKKKDETAIKLIEEMKTNEFIDYVEGQGVSICGYGTIATAMTYVEKLGGKATLLKYANSGDVTKDYASVVGYSSIIFHK